ncbi:hypothetical protein HK102_001400 [Quaeritorhiza haematococci]|nr:hypothetical protein HK102_001400 [Quaeritorhiza haematococci]
MFRTAWKPLRALAPTIVAIERSAIAPCRNLSATSSRAASAAAAPSATPDDANMAAAKSLYKDLTGGKRAALARAITLVESSRDDHKQLSQDLLAIILGKSKTTGHGHFVGVGDPVHTRGDRFPTSFRIGLSGAPGVGKSSFIETFGMYLIDQGHRVAVLAVDPSSTRTGGSILGDKTRMIELSRAEHAFVRPSPSSGTLGGVARNTNEAILLCEAAGYDVILIETVGVGQSETMVADMVDMFTLLVAPGAGDELQGIKKGIVELSDLIIVNKADGDLMAQARAAQMEYTSALKFLQSQESGWKPKVLPVSAREKSGIDKAWDTMKEYYWLMRDSHDLEIKRGEQQKKWMWHRITDELITRLKRDHDVRSMIRKLEQSVFEGHITSGQAADRILEAFLHHP